MGRKLKLGVLVAFFVLMLSACTYAGTYRLTVNKEKFLICGNSL